MPTRILIVEDSDDVRDSYVRWFEKAGFDVTQARDGEQAWSLSRRHRPDVVLLDVELPGMDGYTLAGKWREDPEMARVPVVVLSGRRGEEHEKRAQQAGVLIALAKPCMPDMILAAIRGALPA